MRARNIVEVTGSVDYVMGHAEPEVRRLIYQAALLRPVTERLLRAAGLRAGMRVLDLGCGAGDVAMLCAEMVGPAGSVVGIDRSPHVVEIAAQRAEEAGLHQIEFEYGVVGAWSTAEAFDLVVGRYVLIHQVDPVAFIRAAASLVRSDGVVAFHEPSFRRGILSQPPVPLWDQVGDWLIDVFRNEMPHWDAADRLVEHFSRAGLDVPSLFAELPVGGGKDTPFYDWLAETLRTLLPKVTERRAVSPEAIAIETLARRLRIAVTQARSQVSGPPQICAWAHV